MIQPRIIVLGAGRLGSFHAQKLQQLQAKGEAELAGVVDPDVEARQRLCQKHNIPGHSTLKEFSDQADAVIIAAPTVEHRALTEQALDAGWHVLVEKPIAATSKDGKALVQKAAERNRLLQVGHTERFNPAIAAALQIADRPRFLVAERLGPFSGRSTDIDVILDLMIHDLDIVASLIPSEVVEVRAIGVPVLTSEIDMASVRLAFADGSVAQLSAGRSSIEPSRKIRLFTVERYVSIDCATQEVKSVRRLPRKPNSQWPEIVGEPVAVDEGDALFLQDQNFVHAIQGRCKPRVDGNAGLRALQLAEAINQCLKIPIPDEPGANE